MGVTIQGWVEINLIEDENDLWLGWMDINPIVQFNDEINWIIMGNPKNFSNNKPKYIPIAKERGFPKNVSYNLEHDIRKIKKILKKYPNEMIFGFTHIYYSEIIRIDWKRDYQFDINGNWFDLFELIQMLIELKKLKPKQIRITMWYEW